LTPNEVSARQPKKIAEVVRQERNFEHWLKRTLHSSPSRMDDADLIYGRDRGHRSISIAKTALPRSRQLFNIGSFWCIAVEIKASFDVAEVSLHQRDRVEKPSDISFIGYYVVICLRRDSRYFAGSRNGVSGLLT
jgi:hypothetical protein